MNIDYNNNKMLKGQEKNSGPQKLLETTNDWSKVFILSLKTPDWLTG